MLLYRICSSRYAHDLSGTGAGLYGGRWNPQGLPLLYTAGTISLSYLEYLAHNIHLLGSKDICLVKLEVANGQGIQEIKPSELPKGWRETTFTPSVTQKIGYRFVESGKLYILKVPSAIVPQEFNYILNPLHEDHHLTSVKEVLTSFEIDKRFAAD